VRGRSDISLAHLLSVFERRFHHAGNSCPNFKAETSVASNRYRIKDTCSEAFESVLRRTQVKLIKAIIGSKRVIEPVVGALDSSME
jgi:capsular polysaccharide biosynthesis protein